MDVYSTSPYNAAELVTVSLCILIWVVLTWVINRLAHRENDVHGILKNYLNSNVQEQEVDLVQWAAQFEALRPRDIYQALCSVRSDQGCSAMHKAMYLNHTSVARLLLHSVGTYNQRLLLLKNKTSLTPIHVGASRGHTDLLRQILSLFAPDTRFKLLKAKNDVGHMAIHRAALSDHIDTAECLLSLVTADQQLQLLNEQSYEDETPQKLIERRLAGMRERHHRKLLHNHQFNQEEEHTWERILQGAKKTVEFLNMRQRKAMQDVTGMMDGRHNNIIVHLQAAGTELPQQETTTQAVEETGDNIGGDNNVPIQAF